MAAIAKKPTLAELLTVLEALYGPAPRLESAEDPLLDHLLVAVLARHAGVEGARGIVRAVSESFLDFNEARVSPLFELEAVVKPHVPPEAVRQAAWDLRMTLQDVWDGTHGLDLEPLRSITPEEQRHFLKHLPNIPGGAAALVFQVGVGEKHLAFGPLEEHLLRRLNLLPRSATRERVRAALERQVKGAERFRFTWLMGHGAHLHEEEFVPGHPFCDLLVRAKARELVIREQERKREEVRQKAAEKRRLIEAERQAKADERARIKREREEAQRQRALEIKQRKADAIARKKEAAAAKKKAAADRVKAAADKRKAAAEQKRAAAAKKKAEIKAKADAVKAKAAAQKKAAAEKQQAALAKQKAVAAAKKQAAAAKKKAAAAKQAAAAKKRAAAAKKKAAAKKGSTGQRKTGARTSGGKKKTTRPKTAARRPSRRPARPHRK